MTLKKLSKVVLGTYEFDKHFDSLSGYCTSKDIDWLDTAITYNNDYLLGGWEGKIVSKISPWMYKNYEFWVTNHLRNLNRNQIDVMLVHNTRNEDWIKLYLELLKDPRFLHVGISNASIDQLKEIYKIYQIHPEYVEIELNPNYLDLEMLNYCKVNGIKVIAYAILGGKYKAMEIIKKFTLPYLVKFASHFSDMFILRWDSKVQGYDLLESVNSDIEFDFTDITSSILESKAIVPEVYNLPELVTLDKSGFPYYGYNISEMKIIRESEFDQSMLMPFFTELNDVILEFVTEYQAYVRYLGSNCKVAIINHNGIPTKVNSLGCNIINYPKLFLK